MPRKQTAPPSPTDEAKGKVQISFRGSLAMKTRLEAAAISLGVDDASTLLRMMVTEFLPVYEARGKDIQAKKPQ